MKKYSHLVSACVLVLAMSAVCFAQSNSAPAQQNSSAPQADAVRGGKAGQELAATSNEAAGEQDPNAQFRESGSVKKLAKALNTSTENAFIISLVINFVLLAVILYIIFLKKGLTDFFPSIPVAARNRREAIRGQLQTAQRESESAKQRLRGIESKLAQLGTEISNLNAQAEKQARDEEARLKAAVEEERQRIIVSAEQEIAAAGASAQRDLRAYAAELALELAAKKISIDPSTDQLLVRDFAEQLGRNGK